MRTLQLPNLSAGEVYDTCISKVKDPVLKQRLEAIRQFIVDAAAAYEVAASSAQLHTLNPQTTVGGVPGNELSDVYTSRMARKDAPGRPLYDKLLLAPAHGICPLCGQRKVSTLDHHLAKAHFPALAVVPANLVPACADCNKLKLDALPQTEEEQTIHPYFDDFVDDGTWLSARVVATTPPGVQFFVTPPATWTKGRANRVANHLESFKLAELYASHAAVELENIRFSMTDLFALAGPEGVQAHLMREARSRAEAHQNSWQAALYRALAQNDWYCQGGFSLGARNLARADRS